MQIWRPSQYPILVGTRLDEATVEWMRAKALEERLSVSGYARKILIEAAKRDLVRNDADDAA